jgi:hypothetical protein
MLNAQSAFLRSCVARTARQILTLALIVVATAPAWGSLAVDAVKSTDRSSSASTIVSPTFSTTSGNELLLAFVATDAKAAGITVTGVTGANLTWVLVRRTNAQLGTSEIWRAYAPSILSNVTVTASLSQSVPASITVVTFTGADATGVNGAGAIGNSASANASSGAPSASLVTTRNGSWVFGVGNDWDHAVTHTAASGQTVLHQYLATVGDTYWVQEQNSPTVLSGTTVFINDTAPTTDRYNLTIAEVLPATTSGGTTFTISGSITPAASGAGSTVALTQNGTALASSTADANGNYSFASLANGTYTITPTKTGFTFSPTSQSVTVNGANQTAVNFAAQSGASWSISGTIGGAGCTGCSFVQSTRSSQAGHTDWPTLLNVKAGDALVYIGEFTNWTPGATVNMTDSHGNTWHRCDNNATTDFVEVQDQTTNGMSCQYTLNTAAWPTITAQPVSSQCVNISCTQVGGAFFELALPATATARAWATPHAGTSTSGTNNVSCGSITLTEANDFLMCDFNNASGTPTAGTTPVPFTMRETVVSAIETGLYSGSGTITPTGTLSASGITYTGITVAFGLTTGGAGTTVTLSGSSNASTVTDANGNYSFTGLANGPYTVTPSKAGYIFSPANQPVTINGANQTGVNFTPQIVNTLSISGTISPAASGVGTSVTLSGAASQTVTADSSGNFTFTGLVNGSYTVTPSKSGFTFSPANQPVVVNGANVPGVNFTATALPTWSISGTISPLASGVGTLVTLSGTASKTATADSSGNYTFTGLANGSYTVTPSKTGFTFSPANQPVPVNAANVTAVNFTATAVPTWSISGTITPAASGSGALLTLSGTPSATTTADGTGAYSFSNLPNGTFTVTPTKTGFTFTPPSQTLTISGANVTANFTAQSGSTLLFPDLRDIIPSGNISVVQSGGSKMFQYTHDTLNGGPGPLVIQPAYNAASGSYQGTQYIYTHSGSTWTIAQTIPIAGSFIFDAAHGHFHFPFVTYGLYTVGADGNPGTPIATSGKISFCINDSFIYDKSLPNAGQIGNLGSCSDPLSLRGLNIGAVDEYDQTDEGQSISIAGVPDGTYWLRAVVDPDNYLAEADKTNNETDVEVTISGTNVTVIQQMNPVLPAPPAIAVTSPSAGTISGTVTLTASASTTSGVQFLVDGEPLGGLVTNPTNTSSWDTTTITNGTHWLAAQTTGSTGRVGTSPVVAVTVANSSAAPPVVQITSPTAGSTVNAVVTISATAASSETINSVSFFVDNSLIGTVTAPPYLTSWDTQTASTGTHSLTASATDILGGVGTSPPVSVNVDNSHPPNQLAVDASASIDGNGVMTTPQFNTANDGELLIAFVAYDGPGTSQQTATVSGGGLLWTLLKRSNTQAGTAEIWSARASDAPFPVTVISQPGIGTYHGSLTVIAFVNASGSGIVGQAGAASGPPDIIVPGVSAGNWVFAVGNDWDKAVGRTPVSGQVLVHQRIDTQTGDTYWVQSTVSPATANALVDIHDSAPTTDRWNYAVVEVVATPQ